MLDHLSRHALTDLLNGVHARPVQRGEAVFRTGEPVDGLHFVERGVFGTVCSAPTGETVIAAVYLPGDHFGELGLVPNANRTTTVLALEAGALCSVPLRHFQAVRKHHLEIDRLIALSIAERVAELYESIGGFSLLTVEQRLWHRVRQLIADDPHDIAVVTITQDTLAALVGTTRQTVNRLLRAAERERWVRVSRGRLRILDRAALERASVSSFGPRKEF